MSVNIARRNVFDELKQMIKCIDEVIQDCYQTNIEPNTIEYDDYYAAHCAHELVHYQNLYNPE